MKKINIFFIAALLSLSFYSNSNAEFFPNQCGSCPLYTDCLNGEVTDENALCRDTDPFASILSKEVETGTKVAALSTKEVVLKNTGEVETGTKETVLQAREPAAGTIEINAGTQEVKAVPESTLENSIK